MMQRHSHNYNNMNEHSNHRDINMRPRNFNSNFRMGQADETDSEDDGENHETI